MIINQLSIYTKVKDWFHEIAIMLINALPDSPFFTLMSSIEKNSTVSTVLGYVNYFLPITLMMQTLALWVSCIAIYYAVMAALRWAKVIS